VRNGSVCVESVAFVNIPRFLPSVLLLAGFLQGTVTSSSKGPKSNPFTFILMLFDSLLCLHNQLQFEILIAQLWLKTCAQDFTFSVFATIVTMTSLRLLFMIPSTAMVWDWRGCGMLCEEGWILLTFCATVDSE